MIRDSSIASNRMRSASVSETQMQQIVDVLKRSEVALCDNDLIGLTSLPINIVTARRNKLVELGTITSVGRKVSRFSSVPVHHWMLTSRIAQKIDWAEMMERGRQRWLASQGTPTSDKSSQVSLF